MCFFLDAFLVLLAALEALASLVALVSLVALALLRTGAGLVALDLSWTREVAFYATF